eukprot:jgi/Bigna1/73870/fgenesh1_pg.26_\
MTTLNELKSVIKETLEARGSLNQIKARLRAEIFSALDDHQGVKKPELSSTNVVINELIREYLEFNKYHHTLSVFMPETGQPQKKIYNKYLASELNIQQDPKLSQIPLLYSLVANSKKTTPVDPVVPKMSKDSRRVGTSSSQAATAEMKNISSTEEYSNLDFSGNGKTMHYSAGKQK